MQRRFLTDEGLQKRGGTSDGSRVLVSPRRPVGKCSGSLGSNLVVGAIRLATSRMTTRARLVFETPPLE